MSGSMSSLYVGVSGLKTSQNALNTTAHNLANIDTTGFTRQQVLIKDQSYKTVSMNNVSTNQVGNGTGIQLVRTVRDQFYDKQYRLEAGRQGFYDVQYSAVAEIENVIGETEGEEFRASLDDLWTSFSELVNDSTDIVQRQTAINTSKVFLERASQIQKQIDDYQKSLNSQIISKVDTINSIGKQIADLNIKIRGFEASGIQHANDLRDTRNLLLDKLSSLVNISYKEVADGTVHVSVEGVGFVDGDSSIEMGVTVVNEDSTLLKPVWPSLDQDVYTSVGEYNTQKNTDIGSLKGILAARGDFVANYTSIPKAPNKDDFGTEAEYNKAYSAYEKDVAEYNAVIESSSIMSFQAKFDQLVHGVVTAINDILCPNVTGTIMKDGKPVTVKYLDEANAPIGMGEGNKIPGTELFSRSGTPRYYKETVTLVDENGVETEKELWIYNEEDPSKPETLYTLGQMEINEDVLSNPNLLPLGNSAGTGDYDASVVEKINAMWSEAFSTLDPNSLTNYTFKEYYVALVGDVAGKGNTFSVIAENQETMVNSIDNSRLSITGVSQEEELTNLIKYQHAYNASSRYISTVNSMLESVINSFFS
ncbi:MAG: flagellar hook-associated protein FlgK [bacterium]|nr:flagellar hook-associated protein FlgK [bacterium]